MFGEEKIGGYLTELLQVLLLIHDINRIALEECLYVGGYLLVQTLASS